MKKNIIVIILAILSCFAISPSASVKVVHNTRKEIDVCMGKIQLTLVRTWGGDEEEDENKFFKFPWDMVVDNKGTVYICDESNHRIQVFDENGKYLRTLGRRGNGPTDLLNPNALAFDIQGNLVISDSMNFRVQLLRPEGKYFDSFKCGNTRISSIKTAHKKNEILMYSHMKTFVSRKLLYVFDKKGKIIREIGEYVDDSKEPGEASGISFTLDGNDNIYTTHSAAPYLLKYSYTGDILMHVTFETPYGFRKTQVDISNNSIIIEKEKKSPGASSLTIDSMGRIYILGSNRKFTEKDKEKGSMTMIGKKGGALVRYMPPLKYGYTDLYRLLVFNPSGKIIAAAPLSVYLNKIYIHNDRLFLIDTFRAMCIYEYKMTFK